MKRSLLLVLLLAFVSFPAFADFTGYSFEVVSTDGVTGFNTYRIYAEFDDPNDQLVSVFGYDLFPFNISSTGTFYQEAVGGNMSTDINPALLPFFPSLEYDSWLTLGAEDNVGNDLTQIGFNFSDFETGGDIIANDAVGGAYYIIPDITPQAFPVSGKVLLAQLTSDGDIDFDINIQWRDADGNTNLATGVLFDIPFEEYGCTDPNATNFDPLATADGGNCTYPAPSFNGLSYEVVAIDGVAGFNTYRVYADFTNPFDQLVAVYGQDMAPLSISTDGTFFQDPNGGELSSDVSPALFGTFPSLEYDSWVTLGADAGPSNLNSLGVDYTSFSNGGDLVVNDAIGGAWFVIPDEEPAAFPVNGKVLIGQFTTDGIVNLNVNIQYRAQDGSNPQEEGLSIVFPVDVEGCTNPNADNFDPLATIDDGSCVVSGCTNPDADNFNPDATNDDGSCVISGCTYDFALNYNPDATTDDGSCVESVDGCTDPAAFNFDANANNDDGSCEAVVEGCTDCTATNYDAAANTDDGSCTAAIEGCTYAGATNFDANAELDNGTCEFPVSGCLGDLDANNEISVGDLIILLGLFGSVCQ